MENSTDDFKPISEDECAVCGHLPGADRPAMRELLTEIPLRQPICDQCLAAFWTNIAGMEIRDE